MATQYELTTKSGYDLRLARSALNKAIRRAQELDALYWAAEIHESGYTNYLIYTMATIHAEDVGFASASLCAAIDAKLALWKLIYNEKRAKAEYTPALGAVVLMMCRARKSRCADSAWQLVKERRRAGWRLEIPDVALDEHVKEGRHLGRSYRFWVAQASRIHPQATSDEIGGTDYLADIEGIWLRGSAEYPDEPFFNQWDPAIPDAPIQAITREEYYRQRQE